MRRIAPFALAIFAVVTVSGTALAHPRLVSSSPAANASATKPTQITLTFSETLVAPLTGIELTMTEMPGMASHGPMPIRGITPKVDGKTVTAKLVRPLSAGTYELKWRAVAADQHRIEGSYSFTVR